MTPRGEIWLIRHGETEWSLSGAHTSRTDLPLTAEGQKKAPRLKEILAGHVFTTVLSSPMRRALDTCRLAGYDDDVIIEPNLREWDYGDYEGLTSAQIQEKEPGWTIWTRNPANGETAEQVAFRADRVIEHAVREGGDVAMFGHGHMSRVIAARWLGLDPSAGRFFALTTGSVSILSHEHDTRVLRRWNQDR